MTKERKPRRTQDRFQGLHQQAAHRGGMLVAPFGGDDSPVDLLSARLGDETAGMTANGGPAPAQAEASDSDTLVRVRTGLHPGLAPEQERL